MKELISSILSDNTFADTADGRPVMIDFPKLIGEHTLVAAQTGFGKSVFLRKIEELALVSGYPVIVIDSDGDFASLRETAPNGILIVGGEHGDPDITFEKAIRRLPQIVALRASIIFDIHDLDNERQDSVVARVLSVMMKLPRDLQQPYLIVIDEVQRFAPQRGASKAAAGAIVKVGREGRKLGITLMVASQRLADVSKALTSQTKNRIFGHMSDMVDCKRVGEEIGLSPRQAMALAEYGKGDFLIRGEAFGGPLDKVRIRKPLTGKLGKDHMVEKLKLPVSPIEEVLALFQKQAAETGRAAEGLSASPSVTAEVTPYADEFAQPLAFDTGELSMEALLLQILAPAGRGGLQKDSLALLAASTERRSAFQEAISNLLARKLVSLGTGTKIRITPDGFAAVEGGDRARTVHERLAALRVGRDASDQRVLASLVAAGKTALDPATIRDRTGLGPHVTKAALARLRRDGWTIERRGGIMCSPALARLLM